MRLIKYIHNFNGVKGMRIFEYNNKILPVKICTFDLDSTIYYGCDLLFYNENNLLIRKEGYPLSNNFELSGYYNYYYDEKNRLTKTEAASVKDIYIDFDTYEYDEAGKCIKVFIWYHVYGTGEVKLRQYYRYYYDAFPGSFNHLPFILDGSLRFGIYILPVTTKNFNITKFENYINEDDDSPYNYLEIKYEYNDQNYPILLDYTEYHPNTEPANCLFNYHYIIK